MPDEQTYALALAVGIFWLLWRDRQSQADRAEDQHRITALAAQIRDPTPDRIGAEGDTWG